MRFILNFIVFGIIFYLIYVFFPEAFFTLVSWANKTYEFLKDVVLQITEKITQWSKGSSSQEHSVRMAIFIVLSHLGFKPNHSIPSAMD